MISFTLTKEQKSLQKKLRKVAVHQLRPLLFESESRRHGLMDPRFYQISSTERLNSFIIPNKYGGNQVDSTTMSIIIEELAWGSPDFASFYLATLHAAYTLLIGGSEELKSHFFKLLLDSGGAAAFCLTEEKGGSDSSSFSTTAQLYNGHYILNGTKTPVVNAGEALFYIVWANMANVSGRSGICAFAVPADSSGINCEHRFCHLSCYQDVSLGTVSFNNVKVSPQNLIGIPGGGYLFLMQTLDLARTLIGASCVGIARAAIDEALEFAKTRLIKNRPIIKSEGVSFILSELITDLVAARMLVWNACTLMDSGLEYAAASAMAKLFASELAVKATNEGISILGQKSLSRNSLMQKLQQDAQLKRIINGTSQIQKMVIIKQF